MQRDLKNRQCHPYCQLSHLQFYVPMHLAPLKSLPKSKLTNGSLHNRHATSSSRLSADHHAWWVGGFHQKLPSFCAQDNDSLLTTPKMFFISSCWWLYWAPEAEERWKILSVASRNVNSWHFTYQQRREDHYVPIDTS